MMRTWAEVSLSQLRFNFDALRNAAGLGVTVCPVVKANAYGHGAIPISQALEANGATWLAVSCVSEGVALREAGVRTRILVMGGLLGFEREAAIHHSLTPVVHSLPELREWDVQPVSIHLKIDTGMSRLGATASPAEVVEAVRSLRYATVEGLMSHYASAEDLTSDQSDRQMLRFDAIRTALYDAGLTIPLEHVSSTNGLAYRRTSLSLVRPGLAIYGYVSPSVNGRDPNFAVQPILAWYARLLSVRDISEGTSVGYMARFRASTAMRIGTVAAGYADGIPHRLSTRGYLVANEKRLPILGAVSMDLTTIDLTATPELQPGDAITILGPGTDAQQIANIAGEIPYSVLCGIGSRVTRTYV